MAQGKILDLLQANWLLRAASVATLAVCLFYAAAQAFIPSTLALTVNASWQIIDIADCDIDPAICESNAQAIQRSDRLLKVGDLTFEQWTEDRNSYLFGDYKPGEQVPIVRERDDRVQEILWQMPGSNTAERVMYLVTAIMVFSPFWLVGTALLFFMRPRDNRWRLLVLFNYLTAIWLAAGLGGVDQLVARATLVVHAVSWLMLPIFLHLHLEIPSRMLPRFIRYGLPGTYGISLLMAGIELFQALPQDVYLVPVSAAILISLALLIFRFFRQRTAAERLATRLMLLGILFGFGPGIILAILPIALGSGGPGAYGVNITLLAIPSVPLFYGYAIYKRYLGFHEAVVNQVLSYYAQFLLFLTGIMVITAIGRRFTTSTTEIVRLVIIASSTLMLVSLLSRGKVRQLSLRLAYGIEYDQDKLFQHFAGQIPAVSRRDELSSLITQQLLPRLGIRQSALLTLDDSIPAVLYRQGVGINSLPLHVENFYQLSVFAGRYSPASQVTETRENDGYSWVRLAIALQTQASTNGLWLFGSRKPDDFYSVHDIELLTLLANQVAVTLERGRLFDSFKIQLAERLRADRALQQSARRIELLHQIDQAILAADSPEKIAGAVVEGVFELLPCVRSSVLLFGADGEQPTILAQHNINREFPPIEDLLNAELSNETLALAKGQIQVIEDLGEMASSSNLAREIHSCGVRSILIMPLCSDNRPIGSLNIGSDQSGGFDTHQISIAREVASSLEVALHNSRLLTRVSKHGQELRQLSAMLIDIQETERKRISAELHDEVGQVLTAISFNLVAMEKSLKSGSITDFDDRLEDTQSLVEQVTQHTRSLSHQLRPAMLQDLGLVPTLRRFVSDFMMHRNIAVELEVSNLDGRLPGDVETAIFRIVQEAMTNVSRHAQASRVVVSISQPDNVVRAIIEDDGQGFTPGASHHNLTSSQGIGLVAIRERVTSLDGQFSIHSSPGGGTRLYIEIPLEKLS